METLTGTLGRYTETISEQLSSGSDRVKLRKSRSTTSPQKALSDQNFKLY
ncbi:MAG: hypothetical protein M5R42_16540 [Rhodocyclaceae bacterium]|nr:hypothetical protein [Rhodocyclaceae bacterium]